jgi:F-type H+-transporting ATPase subunit epsilon
LAKLHFSLVAPEREIYAGDVDQVDAPGTEGDFGVLYGHAPFMTTLREGQVTVIDGGARRVFQIQGGFADVTPQGLTILAEHAVEASAAAAEATAH